MVKIVRQVQMVVCADKLVLSNWFERKWMEKTTCRFRLATHIGLNLKILINPRETCANSGLDIIRNKLILN